MIFSSTNIHFMVCDVCERPCKMAGLHMVYLSICQWLSYVRILCLHFVSELTKLFFPFLLISNKRWNFAMHVLYIKRFFDFLERDLLWPTTAYIIDEANCHFAFKSGRRLLKSGINGSSWNTDNVCNNLWSP